MARMTLVKDPKDPAMDPASISDAKIAKMNAEDRLLVLRALEERLKSVKSAASRTTKGLKDEREKLVQNELAEDAGKDAIRRLKRLQDVEAELTDVATKKSQRVKKIEAARISILWPETPPSNQMALIEDEAPQLSVEDLEEVQGALALAMERSESAEPDEPDESEGEAAADGKKPKSSKSSKPPRWSPNDAPAVADLQRRMQAMRSALGVSTAAPSSAAPGRSGKEDKLH